MARIRCIKPEFWTSEQIVECSPIARLLFVGMWNFCDDGGVHPGSIKRLKMEVFPGDAFTDEQIRGWVDELIGQGLIQAYEAEGRTWWKVTGWERHQRVDRPTFKHPQPPNGKAVLEAVTEASGNDRRAFDERSTIDRRALDEPSPPDIDVDKDVDIDTTTTTLHSTARQGDPDPGQVVVGGGGDDRSQRRRPKKRRSAPADPEQEGRPEEPYPLHWPDLPEAERRAGQAHIEACPEELRQPVLDELAGLMQGGRIRAGPLAVLRGLVKRAREGTFEPELGMAVARAREARETRAPPPPATRDVLAEHARLMGVPVEEYLQRWGVT
ncbi:MAG: hypothetical protein D6819_07365 [Gammaproteobacteria bacterium]|nr:MAG: hypothetical protein D6819_07365 [Gammaproteobacteria bacterium]